MKKRATRHDDSIKLIRRGKMPVAVELSIDAYEDLLEQADPTYRASLAQGHAEYERGDTLSLTDLKHALGL